MFKINSIILMTVLCVQSTFCGYLHGDSFSAISAPLEYQYNYAASAPYAKFSSYASPVLASPVISTPLSGAYVGRYASHGGYAPEYAPVARHLPSFVPQLSQNIYAAAPLQNIARYSVPVFGRSSYVAAPVATAYGGFGVPIGSHAASLRLRSSYVALPIGPYPTQLSRHLAYRSPGGHIADGNIYNCS